MSKKKKLRQRIDVLEAQLAEARRTVMSYEPLPEKMPLQYVLQRILMPGINNPGEDEARAYCCTCGYELEHVRPGKWQCNYCEGIDRDSAALAAAIAEEKAELERKNPGWKFHVK